MQEYLTKWPAKRGYWPQTAVIAWSDDNGNIVGYRQNSGMVKQLPREQMPPPPVYDGSLGRDARRVDTFSQVIQQGGTKQTYVPPVTTDVPQRTPPPVTPQQLPPSRESVQAPPLPNLVQNQAAVNQAMTKLAQADILIQRAKALGMQVSEVEKQIAELRQLLINIQQHLMS